MGAFGGLAAVFGHAIGRPLAASAAIGDPVQVGGHYVGTHFTSIDVAQPGFGGLWGMSSAATGIGVGVRGDSSTN